jgi:hypothetical protein
MLQAPLAKASFNWATAFSDGVVDEICNVPAVIDNDWGRGSEMEVGDADSE